MIENNSNPNILIIGFASMDIYPDGSCIPGGAGGGMALNAASLPGIKSNLLAPLGNDKYGLAYRQILKEKRVNTILCLNSAKNPTCVIKDPFGEITNRDWSDNGSAQTLLEHDFSKISFDQFDAVILANALPALIDKLSVTLTNINRPIFYIPGPHIVRDNTKLNLEILSKSEVVFGNQEEASIILNHRPIELGTKVLVETRGKNGSRVHTQKSTQDFPPPAVGKIVDTTGAGDCFALGFIVEYLKNKDIKKAVESGNALAARIISKQGVLL